MPEQWLILADDLTGAADCAIAFTRAGLPAAVIWSSDGPDETVLAIDAETRSDDPKTAALRHRRLVEQRHRPGIGLFKKIDSTLRGQPAAELAETVRTLRDRGERAFAIVAPAFPEAGRTTEQGAIRVHGKALEETTLWLREHSYETADMVAVLEGAGLRTRHLALDTIRAGREAVEGGLQDALADGSDAIVCDAAIAADLEVIARASLSLGEQVFWTGSAGLAQALARSRDYGEAADADQPELELAGGILFVVGSVAEASRAAAAILAADESVQHIAVTPETLQCGPSSRNWQEAQRVVSQALDQGRDLLVEIASGPEPDLSQGAALARQLGELLRPAVPRIGALFITGGETALALLDTFGITGIRLIEEVEPGVPLGETRGALTLPIVTKAGAFGDEGTLRRCLHHFRRLRQTENFS